MSTRASPSGRLPPQKIAPDGPQIRQHRVAGAFGGSRQKRIQDDLLLAAIDGAALLREGTPLHPEPRPIAKLATHGTTLAENPRDIAHWSRERTGLINAVLGIQRHA